ncbi:MAG: 16S rRNA (cytosine(1402)-N(4))-methyltransferase RsmH [Desulfobacterales bacterium]|jgi:16S rRNA (cytosine1402-N4)-methyltransferase|nr:16S rRNA (cytosine(1402)-N(4))-methyltransferase RsmH [Desulfobacterales bacterium]
MAYRHIPVMCTEVLEYLNCRPGGVYADGTLGGAGHARGILEQIAPDGLLIGLDQDADAIANARLLLAGQAERVRLFHRNFADLAEVIRDLGLKGVDGVLLDLGISLHHLQGSGRGFSFLRDEPLDMRMDVRTVQTAADLVNRLKEDELQHIFQEYGEERWSGRIARRIVYARRSQPIRSSGELARLVCEAVPGGRRARIHPATRVFMALRIAVNDELDRLSGFLDQVPEMLNAGGRLCILSFHSLEDRIVKQRLKAMERKPRRDPGPSDTAGGPEEVLKILTRKVVRPGPDEIAANPMARSTKLRAAERV